MKVADLEYCNPDAMPLIRVQIEVCKAWIQENMTLRPSLNRRAKSYPLAKQVEKAYRSTPHNPLRDCAAEPGAAPSFDGYIPVTAFITAAVELGAGFRMIDRVNAIFDLERKGEPEDDEAD